MRNLRGVRCGVRPLSFESQGCFLTKYKSEGTESEREGGAWTLDEELRLAQYEDKSGERGISSPTLYGGTLAALIRPLTRVNRIRTGEEGTGLPSAPARSVADLSIVKDRTILRYLIICLPANTSVACWMLIVSNRTTNLPPL